MAIVQETWGVEGDDAMLAVVAHGLLAPATAIIGFAENLLHRWGQLDDAEVTEELHIIASQGRFLAEMLKDLVRGLPPDVGQALDDLRQGVGPT